MSTNGAGWFVKLLRAVPRLAIDQALCQEDWGVVVFGERDGFKFWFGLSFADEGAWLAHVHHDRLLQRFRAAGKTAYAAMISDFHAALVRDHLVDSLRWYSEAEVNRADAVGAASPDA